MRKFIIITIVFLLFILSLLYFELPLNLIRPVFHQDLIEQCSQENNLDPLLVTALIKVESNFTMSARSHRGATGLMQIMPSTAEDVARELGHKGFKAADLENPAVNIKFGTYYLAQLKSEFNGNEVLALAAYNAGKNKVVDWHKQNPMVEVEVADIPYKETRNYVREVLSTYEWLKTIRSFRNKLRGNRS